MIGVMYVKPAGVLKLARKNIIIRNVKTCANGSNILKHTWSFNHSIEFDNSSVRLSRIIWNFLAYLISIVSQRFSGPFKSFMHDAVNGFTL